MKILSINEDEVNMNNLLAWSERERSSCPQSDIFVSDQTAQNLGKSFSQTKKREEDNASRSRDSGGHAPSGDGVAVKI